MKLLLFFQIPDFFSAIQFHVIFLAIIFPFGPATKCRVSCLLNTSKIFSKQSSLFLYSNNRAISPVVGIYNNTQCKVYVMWLHKVLSHICFIICSSKQSGASRQVRMESPEWSLGKPQVPKQHSGLAFQVNFVTYYGPEDVGLNQNYRLGYDIRRSARQNMKRPNLFSKFRLIIGQFPFRRNQETLKHNIYQNFIQFCTMYKIILAKQFFFLFYSKQIIYLLKLFLFNIATNIILYWHT